MSVTGKWYGKGILNAFGGEVAGDTFAVDYLSDVIKVLLTTNGYTPDQDTHETLSDISNEVANGNGYATGGVTLANKTLGYTAGTNVIKFDADDVSWANATFTARYAVIYKSTGVAGTSVLLGYVDLGGDTTVTNSTFQITWDAAGIFTVTPA